MTGDGTIRITGGTIMAITTMATAMVVTEVVMAEAAGGITDKFSARLFYQNDEIAEHITSRVYTPRFFYHDATES